MSGRAMLRAARQRFASPLSRRHRTAISYEADRDILRGDRDAGHPEVMGLRRVLSRLTALLVRVGRSEAIEWARHFRAGVAIELVRVDEPVEADAWELLGSHADKQWSYVDATSFALMEREGVQAAFAFDHHFAQRGPAAVPQSAIESR